MKFGNRENLFGETFLGAARTRHGPDAQSEWLRDFCHLVANCAESDEKQNLSAQFAWTHPRVPQFLLRPPRLLLVAEAIGKTMRERDERAGDVRIIVA